MPSGDRPPGGRHRRWLRRQRRIQRCRQLLPGEPVSQRRAALALVVVPLATLTFSWLWPTPPDAEARWAPSSADLAHDGAAGVPPAALDRRDRPLGSPPPVPAERGHYSFRQLQDGSLDPVAWDPCRPVHVVVNTRDAPPDGLVLVGEAATSVAAATGLRVVVDGTTTERLGRTRRPVQVARYGDRWAPVLVAFTDETQIPVLDSDVIGVGSSRALLLGSRARVYVTGAVALDGPQLGQLRDGVDGRTPVRAVIEHELGHVMGLDHVQDNTQLMAENLHPGIESFGSGDRAGLARLGAGRCYTDD